MIPAHAMMQVLWFFVPAYLANMSPVLVQGWFQRLATPMDGGRSWRGKRILGDHKTWRGLGRHRLDFLAGAYLFVSAVYGGPVLPTLACLPIVLAGSVAVTAIGWALGLKEAWI